MNPKLLLAVLSAVTSALGSVVGQPATLKDLGPILELHEQYPNSTLTVHPTIDRLDLLAHEGSTDVLASLPLLNHAQAEDLRAKYYPPTTSLNDRGAAAADLTGMGHLSKRACTDFVCFGNAFCRSIGCELCSSNPTLIIGVCLPKTS